MGGFWIGLERVAPRSSQRDSRYSAVDSWIAAAPSAHPSTEIDPRYWELDWPAEVGSHTAARWGSCTSRTGLARVEGRSVEVLVAEQTVVSTVVSRLDTVRAGTADTVAVDTAVVHTFVAADTVVVGTYAQVAEGLRIHRYHTEAQTIDA